MMLVEKLPKIFINMGFMLLYITNDDRLMKTIDLVKFKFHSNENIQWHYMQHELNWIELNSNSTKFNSIIES